MTEPTTWTGIKGGIQPGSLEYSQLTDAQREAYWNERYRVRHWAVKRLQDLMK